MTISPLSSRSTRDKNTWSSTLNSWEKTLLNSSATLSDAIKSLTECGMRIALVVDDRRKLLGTITDGDIRRALLKHNVMETKVTRFMRENPVTVSTEQDRSEVLAIMKKMDILQIPVVDSNGHVVALEILQDLIETARYDNTVFLMAGGFGKRLYPLTKNMPKPLLMVGKRPILETILTQFIDYGFHDFYISTHYKSEMIHDHFGDGKKWGVSIQYVHEDQPMGTAGALGLLPKNISKLPIILMNGDLLTKINFRQLLNYHEEHKGLATMCVREYDFQVPYGVVRTSQGNVVSIVEKPVQKFFINAGIYVLDPRLVEKVDGLGYLDMPSLLDAQIKAGEKINSYPVHEYWLDIGRLEEYERAQNDAMGVF